VKNQGHYHRAPAREGAYFPSTFLYSAGHCWVAVEELRATIGLTEFVFDLVWREFFFVQLPRPGQEIENGETVGAIEALKVALPIVAPVSGIVKEVNEDIAKRPTLAMTSPYSMGWLWRMELTQPIELRRLLRLAEYEDMLKSEQAYVLLKKMERD
jgi:glycine cleavage system H protein